MKPAPVEAELQVSDHLDERQFALEVKRLADSLSFGTDASPFLGSGIEYVQSRLYQPGDPVKAIDWRVTARTGKVYLKEYESPKRMPVYLVVDTSASMCVTSQPQSKYAWAVKLAGALALASLARISPVGLIGGGERDFDSRATLARNRVFLWLHRLRRYRLDEQTTVGRKLRRLAETLESRCLVIVLSDLHDPQAVPSLELLAQEHDCAALQLRDPAERGRTGGGVFRAQEAETGRTFVSSGGSRWLDEEALARELKRGGVDHLVLPIERPFLPRLRGYLRRRNCLGKGTR
ncbi:MAG: DUF58 domain-containing protein [Acidobacteria bacterium]|nr:MAG: DUF58 domain-containing protein [Acidobacteriota bacterium]